MLVWLKSKRHDAFLTNIAAPDFFFFLSAGQLFREWRGSDCFNSIVSVFWVTRMRLEDRRSRQLPAAAASYWATGKATVSAHHADGWCEVLPTVFHVAPRPVSNHVLYVVVQTICAWAKSEQLGFFFFVFFLFRLRFFYSPRQSFYHWCFKWPVKTSTCVDFFLP